MVDFEMPVTMKEVDEATEVRQFLVKTLAQLTKCFADRLVYLSGGGVPQTALSNVFDFTPIFDLFNHKPTFLAFYD